MTCSHPCSDGVDGAAIDDPYKVWECSTCHRHYTEAGGDLPDDEYPMALAKVLHCADGSNMAALHELTGDKRDAYLNMACVAREFIETEDAKEIRQRELHHFEEEQKRIEAEAQRDVSMKAAATERLEADMLRRNRDKYQERGAELEALKVRLHDALDEVAETKAERNRAWAECEKADAKADGLSAKCSDLRERLRVTELDGSREIVRWQARYEGLRSDLEEQARRPKRVLGSVMAEFLLRIDDARDSDE